MSRGKRTIQLSLGVFAHNEEHNIEKALNSIQKSRLDTVRVKQIIVVSSGSIDRTNKIVRKLAEKDSRIVLFEEARRKGKSAAINLFIHQATAPVVVTMSADLRLAKDALEEMGQLFLHDEVGMVGGHPIPTNTRFSEIGAEVKLLWELHHEISLIRPKCGELVGFRNVIREIPHDSAVDEATIEVLLTLLGYEVIYAPQAIVYNKGPLTRREFLIQRRRVQAGHQWVSQKYNYRVVTQEPNHLAQVVMAHMVRDPKRIWPLLRLVGLEVVSRILGWIDYHIFGENPYLWQMIRR